MNGLNYHRKYTHEKKERNDQKYLQHIDRVVCTVCTQKNHDSDIEHLIYTLTLVYTGITFLGVTNLKKVNKYRRNYDAEKPISTYIKSMEFSEHTEF